jgi:hypothetical protein
MSLLIFREVSAQFDKYLASLNWADGVTKHRQRWLAALRAASLSIYPEEAYSKIKLAIERSGGVFKAEKLASDLTRARGAVKAPATSWRPDGAPIVRVTKWPEINQEQREAIIGRGYSLVDLWEASPLRGDYGSEEVIDHLFPKDCLICAGWSDSRFATKSREEWRGVLDKLQFIVPSPMLAVAGVTKDGKPSAHTLTNTGPRRFLVIEQDNGGADEQAGVLIHLGERAPLALVVSSGGKSLHGWFYCQGMGDEQLWPFMHYARQLGACRATWGRSQFVRMPGGRRSTGARQKVFFFNPEVVR